MTNTKGMLLTKVPIFKVGGIQYYEIPDLLNTPHVRALSAMAEAFTIGINVSRGYLQGFFELCDKYVLNQVPKSDYIAQLSAIYDRFTWSMDPIIIYRVAACLYIDDNESMYTIDEEYNNSKIQHWITNKNYEDFFLGELSKGFKRWLPNVDRNSLVYSKQKAFATIPTLKALELLVKERGIARLNSDINIIYQLQQQ